MAATTKALEVNATRATLCACCATLLGVGLGRFAYTPLIPALIAAHWFTPGAAAYLGAANLVGLQMADALQGVELIVVPTSGPGAVNPLDLNKMVQQW